MPVPLLFLLGAACAAGQPSKPAAVSASLRVLVSGEQRGYIEPCGCHKPMLGGLPRRAVLVERLKPDLLVDNGDIPGGVGRQEEMKLLLSARSLVAMGYQAVNVGEKELQIGPALAVVAEQTRLPYVSANVRLDGRSPFPRSVRVKTRARDILVIGVLDEQLAVPSVYHVVPAREALMQELATAQPGDFVIALVHAVPQRAREILDGLDKKISLAVAGHAGDEPSYRLERDGTPLVLPGQRGKQISEVTMDEKGLSLVVHDLEEGLGRRPDIARLFDDYLGSLKEQALLSQVVPTPSNGEYAGTKACLDCHASAAAKWRTSAHAHAFSTLTKARHEWDPECVSCHTVGFGYESGFRSPQTTPDLSNVGCESCHGPSSNHALKRANTGSPGKLGETRCEPCHVPDHSPAFDFETYWPKIQHGE